MKTKNNFLTDNLLNQELKDDETSNGGVSFAGETVKDFIAECGTSFSNINELNSAFKKCGIKPIKKGGTMKTITEQFFEEQIKEQYEAMYDGEISQNAVNKIIINLMNNDYIWDILLSEIANELADL